MRRNHRKNRSAFTLLELMLAIAVIGILMSMLGAAAYSARQRAYVTLATAEAQEIAAAFKSYYLAKHQWPDGFGGEGADLSKQNLGPLINGKDGESVYLDISDFRFEDDLFLDPWGHPYRVATSEVKHPKISDVIEGAVSFPNHFRHYYEESVYDDGAAPVWDWDDYKE